MSRVFCRRGGGDHQDAARGGELVEVLEDLSGGDRRRGWRLAELWARRANSAPPGMRLNPTASAAKTAKP